MDRYLPPPTNTESDSGPQGHCDVKSSSERRTDIPAEQGGLTPPQTRSKTTLRTTLEENKECSNSERLKDIPAEQGSQMPPLTRSKTQTQQLKVSFEDDVECSTERLPATSAEQDNTPPSTKGNALMKIIRTLTGNKERERNELTRWM